MRVRVTEELVCALQHEGECDQCRLQRYIMIPIFDEEADNPDFEGELRFGDSLQSRPWTYRKLKGHIRK